MGNRIIKCCCIDVESESDNLERKIKTQNNSKSNPENSNNSSNLPLKVFSCANIGCYCIIERITDGDTMECLLKIPYSELEKNSMIYIIKDNQNKNKEVDFVFFKFEFM